MVLTAVQGYLIFVSGSGICFNDGCEVVEKLTTVPSLYFNLLGTLFFGVVFICSLVSSINESRNAQRYIGVLLTTALAGEAVLMFFQWSIARVFCSYCLIVFCFVMLLNLLSGWQQILRGLLVFCTVLIACFSLRFDVDGGGGSLTLGTMAQYHGEDNQQSLVLIFSESCPHCERVVDYLREGTSCDIAFNPLERMDGFSFDNAKINENYDPGVSLDFMRSIGLNGVPVLLAPYGDGGLRILNGTDEILSYLEKHCRLGTMVIPEQENLPENGMSIAPKQEIQLPPATVKDDVCAEGRDC